MNIYERETVEFQPIEVQADGATLTDFQVCVVPRGARPEEWVAPTILEGRPGVMIHGLEPNVYEVFVKITDMPEVPVVSAGVLWIQ